MCDIFLDDIQLEFAPPLPPVSKEQKLIGEVHVPNGEYVIDDMQDRRGWKVRLRVPLIPIQFIHDHIHNRLICFNLWGEGYTSTSPWWAGEIPPFTDICKHIGRNDIIHGQTFDSQKYCRRIERVRDLYFVPWMYSPPTNMSGGLYLDSGGNKKDFSRLLAKYGMDLSRALDVQKNSPLG